MTLVQFSVPVVLVAAVVTALGKRRILTAGKTYDGGGKTGVCGVRVFPMPSQISPSPAMASGRDHAA